MNTKRLTSRRRTRLAFAVGSMFLASLTAIAFGQTLTGTVTNATTKKPSVGDDIILLDFSTGTREVGRTQSDSTGRFTLNLDDSRKPRIFQVIHQGASYFKVVPPSSSEVHLEVYDVSKKLSDIAVTADVTRFQVKGDSLQVVRLFAVKNNSAPPRTQMSERTLNSICLKEPRSMTAWLARRAENPQELSCFLKRRRISTLSCSHCVPVKLNSKYCSTCHTMAQSRSIRNLFTT